MAKVLTKQGVLVGNTCKTANGVIYDEYLQIPYAKPPVGNLRFKSPQPPEPWEGQRDATSTNSKNISFQFDFFKNSVGGSEDCLYLNVYTPKIQSQESKLLPVMVCIHGGGFVGGNGIIKENCGPDLLIEHDVVVVAFNYRLGVFGFLSLDIPEAAGNMGLKDQVMALKWIRDNIEYFGGDKDNVTVFGISAGAASVEYLMLSPLSSGLFHKAIMQSGSSINPWAINHEIKDLSIKLAHDLGYQGSNNVREIYEFLMKLPMEQIGEVALKIPSSFTSPGLSFGFVPSIEKDCGNGDEFLTEYPYNLLKDGKFHKMPVVKGFCELEGLLLFSRKHQDIQELIQNRNFLDFWKYPVHPSDIEKYNAMFNKEYFEENDKKNDDEGIAIEFAGDFDFVSGIWVSSKLMAEKEVPVYEYLFAYDGNLSAFKALLDVKRKGVTHGDDISYILEIAFPIELKPSETDILVRRRMTKMWSDFAKTGNPTPQTSETIPITWPLFDSADQKYLFIDNDLQVKSNYQVERMLLCEEIYEKYRK